MSSENKFEGHWVTCGGDRRPHLYDPGVCVGEVELSTDPGLAEYKPPVLTELSREEAEKVFCNCPRGMLFPHCKFPEAQRPEDCRLADMQRLLAAVRDTPAQTGEITPLVHSTLLDMIGFAATGRCMACGWPVKESVDQGCVQGNCSFRPGERTPDYQRWWQRTQLLELARKYISGTLGKVSNAGDIQEAAVGEG